MSNSPAADLVAKLVPPNELRDVSTYEIATALESICYALDQMTLDVLDDDHMGGLATAVRFLSKVLADRVRDESD